MVYETPVQMSIIGQPPKPVPGAQMGFLKAMHLLRLLRIQIVMAQQMQETVHGTEV